MRNDESIVGPVRLGRDAVERVLRRAVELQAADKAPVDALGEAELLDVAREMGIEPQHLRRALAEERVGLARTSSQPGLGDRILGPSRLATGRPVRGEAGPLLEAATGWLERQEGLRIVRRLPDGVSAERDRSALGWLRARVGLARGTGRLREADEVELRIQELGPDEALVTVEADVRSLRGQMAFTFGACGLLVAVAAALAAAAGASGLLLALPGILGAGVVRAISKRRIQRIGRGLEGALDALELAADGRAELTDPIGGALEGARRLGTRLKLLGEALRDGMQRPEK
jgi:hypothetical protein